MKKIILLLLLVLILLTSCAYMYEWYGLYCSADGYCEWMTGGGSRTCSKSFTTHSLPLSLGFSTTYHLVEDTCVVKKVSLY